MTFRASPDPHRSRGFTLVELLVVLVLLSLVVLGLASAIRTGAQTEERVDQRLQRMDDLTIAVGLLRSTLGRMVAYKKPGIVPAGANPFFFEGQADRLEWIGIMPARYGVGGRYHFRLQVDQDRHLIMRYAPWVDASTPPAWDDAPPIQLLGDVSGLTLLYEDASDEPPVWTQRWEQIGRMPDRVLVRIHLLRGDVPDLVIPIRITPPSDTWSSGPHF